MPGICGIASRDPIADIDVDLERMGDALRHFDWYATERFVAPGGQFAVARVHLHLSRFDQTHEGGAGTSERSWLHGQESDGYTRVEYDPAKQTVTIANDRFGMMPLFYWCGGGTLVFATELKAVVAHSAVECRLDDRGLADLLAFGFILGQKTLAHGVECLPGGARLRFSLATGELRVDRVWDFRDQLGRGTADDVAHLDRVNDCFREAVRRRCEGNSSLGVSLSGGYDSRTIMAAIDQRLHNVQTLTLDVRGGADQMIAQQIAAATNGLENHHFVENGDDFFVRWPDFVREMVWLSDGMFYDEACVMMSTLDLYRDLGVGVVLRGHGGELARMHEAYELRCNRHVRACRTQPELIDQLFRQMNFAVGEDDLTRLFVPEVAARLRGAARTSLDEAFAGVDPAWHVADQVSCLYVQQYLPRQCVPSMALLRSRVDVSMPLLDSEYVAAVLQLSPETRLTTRVHRHLLARNNPALLRITNANNGAPAGAGELRQRVTRKALQLAKRYVGYDPYRHYVDVPGWLRGPLRPFIRDTLLDERTLSRGLLKPDALRELVCADGPTGDFRPEVLLLLTFLEMWHRQFVDGDRLNHSSTNRSLVRHAR